MATAQKRILGGIRILFFQQRKGIEMFGLPTSVKIFLAAGPTDLRKGFNGLSGIVREWGLDLFSGHLFVFFSRRGTTVKILTWDKGGFVVWHKRLELGRYRIPKIADGQSRVQLDAGQLSMLLDGVDLSRVKRQKRWAPKKTQLDRILY